MKLKTLLPDFIHLGYLGGIVSEESGIIGVDTQKNLVICTDFSISSDEYAKKEYVPIKKNGAVVNVFTDNFLGEESTSHFVVLKNGQNFNSFIYHNKEEILEFPQSTSAPFLITDSVSFRHLVVLCDGTDTKFYEIKKDDSNEYRFEEKEEYKLDVVLHPEHTSSFIDLTGNFIPDLVLCVKENGKRFLNIYTITDNNFELVQKLPLPDMIGPTLFFDSNDSKSFDLVYVSIENGESYINIHENLNNPDISRFSDPEKAIEYLKGIPPKKVFSEKADVRLNLKNMFGNDAVIQNEHGMPTGLFIADVEGNGNIDLLVTLKDRESSYVQAISYNDRKFDEPEYAKEIKSHRDVISTSIFGLYKYGGQNLLINCIEEGTPILKVIKTKELSDDAMIKVITMVSYDKDGSVSAAEKNLHNVFGVTNLLLNSHVDGNKSYYKVSQSTHTSYPSLQSPVVYIAIKDIKSLENYVITSTNLKTEPGTAPAHHIRKGVTPNTFLVFIRNEKRWFVKEIVAISYSYKIMAGLLVIWLLNLFILLVMSIMGARAESGKSWDRASFDPLFAAL